MREVNGKFVCGVIINVVSSASGRVQKVFFASGRRIVNKFRELDAVSVRNAQHPAENE